MKLFELFGGHQGEVISAMLLLPLLTVMWMISRKMPKSKKSLAHLNISITVLISIAYYVIVSMGSFLNRGQHSNEIIGDMLLIGLFYGVYLLFNESPIWKQAVNYGAFAGAGLLAICFLNVTIACIVALCFAAYAWYIQSNRIPIGKKPQWILGTFFIAKFTLLLDILTNGIYPVFSFITNVMPVVTYTIFLSALVDYLIQLMQGTYVSSISDGMTGLYNKKYFDKCVNQCVAKKVPASLIFIDIDNFKKLNDSEGHQKGDEILKKVSRILREETETIGLAGRYGGEEMVALIVEGSVDMDDLTETIRRRIKEEAVFTSKVGEEYVVTASIGYCRYAEGWTAGDFVKKSDEAMYIAKKTGKNKVVEYEGEGYSELEALAKSS